MTNLSEHKMHAEYFEISDAFVRRLIKQKRMASVSLPLAQPACGRLNLESQNGAVQPFRGETEYFYLPGLYVSGCGCAYHEFSFAGFDLADVGVCVWGYERVMGAYRHAVEQEYRFLVMVMRCGWALVRFEASAISVDAP